MSPRLEGHIRRLRPFVFLLLVVSCTADRTSRAAVSEAGTLPVRGIRTIGGGEPDGVEFGSIAALAADRQDRVFVLDRQVKSVRVFRTDGRSIRTIGRPGSGPGEFVNPLGMTLGPAGELWIVDVGRARYVVYDTTGALIREFPRQILGWDWPWDGGFRNDGAFCDPGTIGDHDVHDVMLCLREQYNELVPIDTMSLPTVESSFLMAEGPNGPYAVSIPHARRREARLTGGRLWIGFTDRYRLSGGAGSDARHVIERRMGPVPMSAPERSTIVDSLRNLGVSGSQIADKLDPNRQVFETFTEDDSNRMWVLRDPYGPGVELDVYDAAGSLLGTVHADLAASPRPAIVGNVIWGVRTDELDVPVIVRQEVELPSNGRTAAN